MEEFGRPQRPHKPKIVGSNPTRATNPVSSKRQDAWLLITSYRFDPCRRSQGGVAHPVRALARQARGSEFKSRRHRHVRVAQLAEHLDDNQKAAGSAPAADTMPP